MKVTNKILLGLSFVLVTMFSGCGSSSSSTTTNNDATSMILSSSYTMASDGVINKTSDNANIELTTDINTSTTTAKLTSGSATCTGCTVN